MPNGSSYFDAHNSVTSRGTFGRPDEHKIYATSLASILSSSRQSQGSPVFQDHYRPGHTPSNSIHSQRQMSNHTTSYSTQSANQRAFNMNKQIEEDVSAQFSRRLALESSNGTSSYAQSQQAFQLNPGSQPWTADGPSTRFGGLDTTASDALAAHYASSSKRPLSTGFLRPLAIASSPTTARGRTSRAQRLGPADLLETRESQSSSAALRHSSSPPAFIPSTFRTRTRPTSTYRPPSSSRASSTPIAKPSDTIR